ncbi:hypothetical protein HK100_012758 [Physocladia obscura]|uniref:SH3 domain-containing protein n=1 Tax=Physocladia obscura TaxID=109957 RepID=A0AAD5XC89_9FUNG|nr:hypothetical protein HK100_012758 [Physocladia obscura]
METMKVPAVVDQLKSEGKLAKPEFHIALFDFVPTGEDQRHMQVAKDEVVKIYQKAPSGWWYGVIDNRRGWIPSNFLRPAKKYKYLPEMKFGSAPRPEPSSQSIKTVSTSSAPAPLPVIPVRTASKRMLNNEETPDYSPTMTDKSLPDSDNQTNVPYTIRKMPQLPQNWGQRVDPKSGRLYYFNYKSDHTTYSLEYINPETGDLTIQRQPHSNLIQKQIQALSLVSYPRFETSEVWKDLIQEIVKLVEELDSIARVNQKIKFLPHSRVIIETVGIMIRVSSNQSQAFENDYEKAMMIDNHALVLDTLSKLETCTAKASELWPPPDAVQNMQAAAAFVLASMRVYAVSAMKSRIPINENLLIKYAMELRLRSEKPNANWTDTELVMRLNSCLFVIRSRFDSILASYFQDVHVSSLIDLLGLDIDCILNVSKDLITICQAGNVGVSTKELEQECQESLEAMIGATRTFSITIAGMKSGREPVAESFEQLVKNITRIISKAADLVISIKFIVLERMTSGKEKSREMIICWGKDPESVKV